MFINHESNLVTFFIEINDQIIWIFCICGIFFSMNDIPNTLYVVVFMLTAFYSVSKKRSFTWPQ